MVKYISIRSDGKMANKYSAEERVEALKLADEIGAAAAAQRLGMNADTIYGWRNRAKNKGVVLNKAGQPMNEDEIRTENTGWPKSDAKLYLAPVLDCYDGTIRGFKMDTNMRAELCVEAFE